MKNYYTTTKLLSQLLPEFFLNNTRYFIISSSKILYTYIITESNQLYVNMSLSENLLLPIFHKLKNPQFKGFSDIFEGSSDFSNHIKPLNFPRSWNYYQKKQFSEIVDFSGFFQVVVKQEGS